MEKDVASTHSIAQGIALLVVHIYFSAYKHQKNNVWFETWIGEDCAVHFVLYQLEEIREKKNAHQHISPILYRTWVRVLPIFMFHTRMIFLNQYCVHFVVIQQYVLVYRYQGENTFTKRSCFFFVISHYFSLFDLYLMNYTITIFLQNKIYIHCKI